MMKNMDLVARTLHKDEYDTWEKWIGQQSHISIYQSKRWIPILQDIFSYRAELVGLFGGGEICGGLFSYQVSDVLFGRKLVSIPHDASSGIVRAQNERGIQLIAEKLLEQGHADKVRHVEIRTPQKLPLESPYQCQQPFLLAELELTDTESLWSQLNRKTRNKVRQSERKGLTVRLASSWDEIHAFYRILLQNFISFGNPCLPRSYFMACFERFDQDTCRFLISYHDADIVGGILLLAHGDTVVYKIGAINSDSKHLRPFNLMIWEGIKWSASAGYKYFSFGSTDPVNTGLIRFKEGFGAQISPLYFYCAPVQKRPPDYSTLFSSKQVLRKLWRLLPLSVAGPLGGRLRRWYC